MAGTDNAVGTVGFIGLGIMGSRMAANLVRAGFDVIVNTRTAANGEQWSARHGAPFEPDARALASRSDVVITMLVDDAQVSEVLGDEGVAGALRAGTLVIDMSTIGPDTSRSLAARLDSRGVRFLDAPVTGSSPRAEDATLTIMVGGDAADLERARPLLEAIGSTIVHAGPHGHGSALKLVNNTLAAANAVAIGEALLLANKLGLDLDALVRVVAAGSGGSAMLDLKAGSMREHDYTTLFKLEHMLKDVRLCLQQAAEAGIPFNAGVHAEGALTEAHDAGFAEADFAAVIEALERRAGERL